MGLKGITVAEVTEFAQTITDSIGEMIKVHGTEDSEDYSDAVAYIADLYNYVSARMLYNVYKHDNDREVVELMAERLQETTETAEAALEALGAFGIRRTTIDDI